MSHRSKRRRSSAGAGGECSKELKVSNMKALIIDSGASSIKIGYSYNEGPKIIPNCIMKAKSERKRLFIGNQIEECRDCSSLFFLLPCERGYITRWEVQKPIWDYALGKNVCPIADHPIILTQPLFNFKSIQDCMDEIFFEDYEVPSLFRLNPTDLAKLQYTNEFHLSQEDSVLIIDTGYSFTHIIPYIKGNKYLRAIKRLNVGGKLLTNHLKDVISYRQYNVMEETYVINQVKEDTCYVAEDIREDLKLASKPFKENKVVRNYVLPDFNSIRRGFIQDPEKIEESDEDYQILRLNNERFAVPEILFHPSDIGIKSMGIAEAAVKSIFLCPKEYQTQLARNIVLIGGNCKFPGFKQRMYNELRSLLPNEWHLQVHLPEDPISYAWQGGKELLKIPEFEKSLITREQYNELGSAALQQRFNSFMSDNSEPQEEESLKTRQHFSYLERLKSRSIFGKTDAFEASDDDQNNPFDNTLESERITTRHCKDNEKETNSTLAEDTLQESTLNASELGETTKLGRRPKKNEVVEHFELKSNFSDEDDLLRNPELFPLGTGSYL